MQNHCTRTMYSSKGIEMQKWVMSVSYWDRSGSRTFWGGVTSNRKVKLIFVLQDIIFMNDNATHPAHITIVRFQESAILHLEWPAMMLDQNTSETSWNDVLILEISPLHVLRELHYCGWEVKSHTTIQYSVAGEEYKGEISYSDWWPPISNVMFLNFFVHLLK